MATDQTCASPTSPRPACHAVHTAMVGMDVDGEPAFPSRYALEAVLERSAATNKELRASLDAARSETSAARWESDKKSAAIQSRDATIAKRDREIVYLKAVVAKRDETVTLADKRIEHLVYQCEESAKRLEAAEGEAERLKGELADANDNIVAKYNGANQVIGQQYNVIATLRAQLARAEEIVAVARELRDELWPFRHTYCKETREVLGRLNTNLGPTPAPPAAEKPCPWPGHCPKCWGPPGTATSGCEACNAPAPPAAEGPEREEYRHLAAVAQEIMDKEDAEAYRYRGFVSSDLMAKLRDALADLPEPTPAAEGETP